MTTGCEVVGDGAPMAGPALARRLRAGLAFQWRRMLLWLSCLTFAAVAHAAGVRDGDILLLDSFGGTNFGGAVVVLDPATGRRSVLSDFGDPAQGPAALLPLALAVGPKGEIYVADVLGGTNNLGGLLFRIDPATGRRKVISDFGRGRFRGQLGLGADVDAHGDVLVAKDLTALVLVRPKDGRRTVITDLADPSFGPVEATSTLGTEAEDRFINDVILESKDTAVIATAIQGTFEEGSTFRSRLDRVDLKTGRRSVISELTDLSKGADRLDIRFTRGMAIDRQGNFLIVTDPTFDAPRTVVARIDGRTGQREVVSDFDDQAQGATLINLVGMAIEDDGRHALVAGMAGDPGGNFEWLVMRLDTVTGRRSILSNNGDPAQGARLDGVAVIRIYRTKVDARAGERD